MSNIIQIKHGSGVPNGKLAPYELGYSDTEEKLYIGGPLEDDQFGGAKEILGGSSGSNKVPKAAIIKGKTTRNDNQTIKISCANLEKNTSYKLYLYTFQKQRGKSSRYWRHPADKKLYNDQGNLMNGLFTGFANIANREKPNSGQFPEVPEWMSRNEQEDPDLYKGVLQTEWEFTTGNNTSYVLELNINTWILPLLKPSDEDGYNWTLMGVPTQRPNKYTRLFQFRVVKEDQIGIAENFMAISDVSYNPQNNECLVKYLSIRS